MKSNSPSKAKVKDALAKISRASDIGAILTIALMVCLGLASYQQLRTQQQARHWVLHTYEVLSNLEQARTDTLRAELVSRKYFDTYAPQYVTRFDAARRDFVVTTDRVSQLVQDNPEQLFAASELKSVVLAFLTELDTAIKTRDEKKLIPLEREDISIQIAEQFKGMLARENALLAKRTQQLNEYQQFTFGIMASAMIFAVLMQSLFAFITRYWARAQRETEQELKATLSSMGEGLAQIDLAGNIGYMNPTAELLLGYSLKEALGKNLHNLIHYLDIDGQPRTRECGLRNVIRTGRMFADKNDVFVRKNGSLLPVEYTSSPLIDDSGTISGAVLCFSDITERMAVETRLREFYSIVSHELRTPLTSIRAAFGLLEGGVGGQMTPKGKHLIEIGRQESDRLVRLINNILDMKKIETGNMELQIVELQCAAVARDCIHSLNSFAGSAGVSLIASVPEDISIMADADRTAQVLTNLLSNAIKFSREATMVSVRVVEDEAARIAKFEVKDFGPGIPPDKLSLLFGMFQQVDSTDSRAKGGTGLGLAISKAIVEAHGGTIGVDSIVGEGSTFWFTMPLARAHAAAPVAQLIEQRDPNKKLVLMIDDDEATCQLVKQKMEQLGFDCMTAVNGNEAIRMAKHYHPEVLVLDILMDGESGFDVVARLRIEETCKAIPLVVYTAKDLTEEDKQQLSLGPTAWLIKSKTTDEELERTVQSMLHSS